MGAMHLPALRHEAHLPQTHGGHNRQNQSGQDAVLHRAEQESPDHQQAGESQEVDGAETVVRPPGQYRREAYHSHRPDGGGPFRISAVVDRQGGAQPADEEPHHDRLQCGVEIAVHGNRSEGCGDPRQEYYPHRAGERLPLDTRRLTGASHSGNTKSPLRMT